MEIDNSITLNPIASAPHLALGFVIIVLLAGWITWKSTRQTGTATRLLILLCRVLLFSALLLFALNPGKWIENREENESYWAILADRSLSMNTPDGDEGKTRWEFSGETIESIIDRAKNPEKASLYTFDSKIASVESQSLSDLEPDGDSTDLVSSVDGMLSLARNRSGNFKGAIILTDGRQTDERTDATRIALRARATESPFYILPVGGEVKAVDLSIRPARRQFVAFAGKECTITAKIKAEGLGSIRPEVILRTQEGEEIARQQAELPEGKEQEVRFTIPAPEPGVHLYEFSTPDWPKERIAANNSAVFTLSVLEGETNIFMAEGAPFWDSKFLAQMIRRQKNMRITSVYRLSEDRFFKIETGDDLPSQESENSFPDTKEALGKYDLIVIGKGAEYFLDEKRLALLSEFVRDRGGSVLFTRGKPYRGEFEGLEFLEPVKWGGKITQPFQLEPTEAGEAAGLFGDLLPGADDPVWQKLPALEESHQTLEMKPFTEVLLEGRWVLDGREQTLPVLMSRRFGRGMTVMLNADGLWQWDFFPSEEGIEGQYEEFWNQLIQWAITFSEFLPGQDLSLNLDQSIIRPGQRVRSRIGYRGRNDDEVKPEPALRIFRDGQQIREVPAARPGEASARWESVITLDEPGAYRVQAINLADPDKPGPSLPVTVLPPPSETEQLSADPEFITVFAETTGGRAITVDEIPEIVSSLETAKESVDRAKAVWQPLWDHWWWFVIVLFIAALEWFTRRRSGLL